MKRRHIEAAGYYFVSIPHTIFHGISDEERYQFIVSRVTSAITGETEATVTPIAP